MATQAVIESRAQREKQNAEALRIVSHANDAGHLLTQSEKDSVNVLYTGLGGLRAASFEEYLRGTTRLETLQQYYTPATLGYLMLDALDVPDNATIWDGAIGVGRMFYRYAQERNIMIAGVEFDPDAYMIAKALFDDSVRFSLINDTLALQNPARNQRNRYDYCFGNPPYSIPLYDISQEFENVGHTRKGNVNSHFAYMEAAYNSVREDGIIGVIMPTDWLTRGGTSSKFRKWWQENTVLLAEVDLGVVFEATASPVMLYYYQRADNIVRRMLAAAFDYEAPRYGYGVSEATMTLRYGGDVERLLETGLAPGKNPEEGEELKSGWWVTTRAIARRSVNHKAMTKKFTSQGYTLISALMADVKTMLLADPLLGRLIRYARAVAGTSTEVPRLDSRMQNYSRATAAFAELQQLSDQVELASNPDQKVLIHLGKPLNQQSENRPVMALPNGFEAQGTLELTGAINAYEPSGEAQRPVLDLVNRFLITHEATIAFLASSGIETMMDKPSGVELDLYRQWKARQTTPYPREHVKIPLVTPEGEPVIGEEGELAFKWGSDNYGKDADSVRTRYRKEWESAYHETSRLWITRLIVLEPEQYLAQYYQERMSTTEGKIDRKKASALMKELGLGKRSLVFIVPSRYGQALDVLGGLQAPRIGDHPDATEAAFIVPKSHSNAYIERVKPHVEDTLPLYGYQRRDVADMYIKDRALLAYVMGLGKTRTALALAMLRRQRGEMGTCGLVVPAGLIEEWLVEMQVIGIPRNQINVLSGDFREVARIKLLPNDEYVRRYDWNRLDLGRPFTLMSIEALAESSRNAYAMDDDGYIKVDKTGKPVPAPGSQRIDNTDLWLARYLADKLDMVVVDEAYKFLNIGSARTKALWMLKPRHRIMLTGTPIKGYPQELHTLLMWLLEDIPGRFTLYGDPAQGALRWSNAFGCQTAERVLRKETKGETTYYFVDFKHEQAVTPAISNVPHLQKLLSSCMIRRTRDEPLGADAEKEAPPLPQMNWVAIPSDNTLRVTYEYARISAKMLQWWQDTSSTVGKAFRGGRLPVLADDLNGKPKRYGSLFEVLGEIMQPIANLGLLCSVPQLTHAPTASEIFGKSFIEKSNVVADMVSPTTYYGFSEELVKKIEGALANGGFPTTGMQDFMAKKIHAAIKNGEKVLFITDNYAGAAYRLAWARHHGMQPLSLTGSQSTKTQKTTGVSPRRAQLNLFRRSPDHNLLIATVQTIAEGYNIPEASTAVFDFIAWTPSVMKQAAYRMARPGQKRQPVAWWPFVIGTIMSYHKFLNTFKARSIDELLDWKGLAEFQESEEQTLQAMFAYLYAASPDTQKLMEAELKTLNKERVARGLPEVSVPAGGTIFDIDNEEVVTQLVNVATTKAKFQFVEEEGAAAAPRGVRGTTMRSNPQGHVAYDLAHGSIKVIPDECYTVER